MDEHVLFSLLVDLFRDADRQGPGSDDQSRRALDLSCLDRSAALRVADIGCGTGASTLVLADQLPNARITAVDLFPQFLEVLNVRALAASCEDRITTLAHSMDSLPFAENSLDLIWSEGAIYNVGFHNGINLWRPFLKPGGVLAVSEITWLRDDPPQEVYQHWQSEYPEIATATEKLALLKSAGYDMLGYFMLPTTCWIDNYYNPTEQRIESFLQRHQHLPEAYQVVEMERREAELYRRFHDAFSYGFYVASKRVSNS